MTFFAGSPWERHAPGQMRGPPDYWTAMVHETSALAPVPRGRTPPPWRDDLRPRMTDADAVDYSRHFDASPDPWGLNGPVFGR